jgi:hypothetical protein
MASWYKIKDKSIILSQEILSLQRLIEKNKAKIKNIRANCTHIFEVLESGDGWDEWSSADCEVEERIHCTICGEERYSKTGRINHH